jgi:F-box domain
VRPQSRLPVELWLDIICYLTSEDVQRLSRASRSLRSLLLPHVLSTITLSAHGSPLDTARSLSKDTFALRHVRHINFKHPCMDGCLRSSPGYPKAAKTISKIIPHLLQLYSVVLEEMVLTVDVRRALFASPSLRSLALHHVVVSPLRAEKTASKITHLSISNVVTRDPLYSLVSDLSHSLESIELGRGVHYLLAKLYGGVFPKLTRTIVHPVEGGNPTLLGKLLTATPTLTTLSLPTTSVLPGVPPAALPGLSDLTGPVASISPLVKSRPIRKLRILDREKSPTTFGSVKAVLASCPTLERLELPNQFPDISTLCYRLETLSSLPCGATLRHLIIHIDVRADDGVRPDTDEELDAPGPGLPKAISARNRAFPLVDSNRFDPAWKGRALSFPQLRSLHLRIATLARLSRRYCQLWTRTNMFPLCPRLREVEYVAYKDDTYSSPVESIRYWRVVGGPWEVSVQQPTR